VCRNNSGKTGGGASDGGGVIRLLKCAEKGDLHPEKNAGQMKEERRERGGRNMDRAGAGTKNAPRGKVKAEKKTNDRKHKRMGKCKRRIRKGMSGVRDQQGSGSSKATWNAKGGKSSNRSGQRDYTFQWGGTGCMEGIALKEGPGDQGGWVSCIKREKIRGP